MSNKSHALAPPTQGDVLKWEGEEMRVQEQLNQVLTVADSLSGEREGLSAEKRAIERAIRELSGQVRDRLREVQEKTSEMNMLVTTRENCIAM